MNALLSLPRIALLVFLSIIGPFLFAVTFFTRGEPLEVLIFAGVMTLLLYLVKKSRFLKPNQKVKEVVSDAVTGAKEKMAQAWEEQLERNEQARDFQRQKAECIGRAVERSNNRTLEVTVLGGQGWDDKKGRVFLLSIEDGSICMTDLQTFTEQREANEGLRSVEIAGPGKITKSAGVSGGGFGVEGAIKGIAAATLINILTTHSSTKTIIRLGFEACEMVLLTSQIEPEEARVFLSPLYVQIRRSSAISSTELPQINGDKLGPTALLPNDVGIGFELERLHKLKQDGAITTEEFDLLKAKLIG
jgi:hypothetical protein